MDESVIKFIKWCESKLANWDFCDKSFPQFTKDERDYDMDVKYNYIYHRFNYSLNRKFIHMLSSTPTYRRLILSVLYANYNKEDITEELKRFVTHAALDRDILENYWE